MQGMRDLLRGSLGRSLRGMTPEDRLAAAWPVACGVAMASHGIVAGFEGGLLRVTVSDTAWLAQMKGMRSMLASDLSRIAGVRVSAIHFELKT